MNTIQIGELDIHYIEKGSGPVFLIFPENLHSSQAYLQEVEHFCDRFRVLSFDYPGTGRSTRKNLYEDEREVDLWGYRADLACHLLMALGIDSCFVLGAGFAALSALHFAGIQAPQHRLSALGVLVDSFLPNLDNRTLNRTLDMREHFYTRRAKALEEQHGQDWREVVDADTAFLRRMADRGGYELPGFIARRINCPVLLSGNLMDSLTPEIAKQYGYLSERIPNCSLYLASKPGSPYIEHPFMWSNPVAFRQQADWFLANL